MLHALGILPKAFQIVKHAVFMIKNMHHYIHIIYQRPLHAVFRMVGLFAAEFPNLFCNVISNSLYLYMGFCFTEYKKIRYGFINFSEIKGNYFLSFFVL